jgi:hypothetical protein
LEGKRDTLVLDLSGASEIHNLVSAPALVGGSRCKSAPNGVHTFGNVDGRAVCACGTKLPCWASLEAGGPGTHTWLDEPVSGRRSCKHCAKPQCENSPSWAHEYTPIAGFRQQCMYCDVVIPAQLGSMHGASKNQPPPPNEVSWARLHTLHDKVEAVDLGDHGVLYRVVTGELDRLVWLPRRAKNPRPLTDGPVDRWHADQVSADLVLKAARRWDAWKAEVVIGGAGRVSDAVGFRLYAAKRAVESGVSTWRR